MSQCGLFHGREWFLSPDWNVCYSCFLLTKVPVHLLSLCDIKCCFSDMVRRPAPMTREGLSMIVLCTMFFPWLGLLIKIVLVMLRGA